MRVLVPNCWRGCALSSNTIDVHLARLRAKLIGSAVRIETVRGVGYRMVAG
jgi:two-component system response regulator TctD